MRIPNNSSTFFYFFDFLDNLIFIVFICNNCIIMCNKNEYMWNILYNDKLYENTNKLSI